VPDNITRAQLARNIAALTGDKESGIEDVLKNKLSAKEDSVPSMKRLATDLRAVYKEIISRKYSDESKKKEHLKILRNEIESLGEDARGIKFD
jgi:hypothetical protein